MERATSSIPILSVCSLVGSNLTCTAYFCAPSTCTCATPSTIEMRCAILFSAYSSTTHKGSVGEVTVRKMMGESAGFTLRNEGGLDKPGGSSGMAAAMAVCTSTAAPSILRLRSNCRVICVDPSEFTEVIESMPAMVVNWRSSGVATDEAMVDGSAPGRLAETLMVGKSTLGRSLTGKAR